MRKPSQVDPEVPLSNRQLPQSVLTEFCQAIQQLHSITQQLLPLSEAPQLPALNQMILQREELIAFLNNLLVSYPVTFSQLNPAYRFMLEDCQVQDSVIQKNLSLFQQSLDLQLKRIKKNQTLIQKYKITSAQAEETRDKTV
jgi:hypothetical protein